MVVDLDDASRLEDFDEGFDVVEVGFGGEKGADGAGEGFATGGAVVAHGFQFFQDDGEALGEGLCEFVADAGEEEDGFGPCGHVASGDEVLDEGIEAFVLGDDVEVVLLRAVDGGNEPAEIEGKVKVECFAGAAFDGDGFDP